jgi:hypothetical protein
LIKPVRSFGKALSFSFGVSGIVVSGIIEGLVGHVTRDLEFIRSIYTPVLSRARYDAKRNSAVDALTEQHLLLSAQTSSLGIK